MQETDINTIIIEPPDNQFSKAMIVALAMGMVAEAMTTPRGIIIVGPEGELLGADDEKLPATIKPEILEIHPFNIEPLEDISYLRNVFKQNEAIMHKQQKRQMQSHHNQITKSAWKNKRTPPAFLTRKF